MVKYSIIECIIGGLFMKKVICMLISVLLLNTFAISTVVHATEASNNTESVSEVDEAKVKEVEEILRFLIEDAGIRSYSSIK